MTRIILVRHGETTWNKEGRYQGQIDTPLSQRGIEQGQKAAEALKDIPIDRFIATPLSRSYDTCQACAAYHEGSKVEIDPRIIEIAHGAWEGMLADNIQEIYGDLLDQWRETPAAVTMPEGESLEDVRQRCMEAFNEYAEKYAGETVLIVAHDAVNKVVVCDILGLPLDHFWQIKQDNTCINVLEYDQDKKEWRIVLLNNTNHLGFLFSGIEQKGL